MLANLRAVTPLLISTIFLLMGVGLLHTLVALRGEALGFSVSMIGTLTSAYYGGFLAGTYLIPKLVHRIGHIRAFAFCTALVAVSVLLQLIFPVYGVWFLMRLMQGLLLVGLYAIIESWLNGAADARHRGSLFAVYMMLNLGASALAQQFLRLPGEDFVLFCVVAILFCVAGLPVVDSGQHQPRLQSMPRVRVLGFFKLVPTALFSALISGLALGAFWGLLPLYAAAQGFDTATVGTYVMAGILGGVLLQLPLGHFSERIDRRLALALIAGVASVVALVNLLLPTGSPALAMVLVFAFGGMSFAVYPIALAHLVDYVQRDDLLSASSTVLLVNGVGSALGPLAAGALMDRGQASWLFGWFALLNALLAGYALLRFARRHRDVSAADRFVPMVNTTASALRAHRQAAEQDPPGPT